MRIRCSRGVTLLEVMVTTLIIAIAVTAALEITATHRRSARLAEERRAAQQAAVAKIDQLRVMVVNGVSLDGIFQLYGPLDYGFDFEDDVDTTTGDEMAIGWGDETDWGDRSVTVVGPGYDPDLIPDGAAYTNFAVGEDANNNGTLEDHEDLNQNGRLDTYLPIIEGRPLGSVNIIFDETPDESTFGFLHGQQKAATGDWSTSNPFGVDINGNRFFRDDAAKKDGAGHYSFVPPFPMDLNGDGVINGLDGTPDDPVFSNFRVLPVVITIQWTGPYGPERYDHFALITKE